VLAVAGFCLTLLWNRSLRKEIECCRYVEDQLQRLADNTPGVIFRYQLRADGSDQLLYVSPASWELWELAPETIMQDPETLKQLIAAEDLERLHQSLDHSADTLDPWATEWQARTPSGRQMWMQLIAKPQPQANGSIIWDGLVLDITERIHNEAYRQQAEQALRESERRYRQVVEAQSDFILRSRPDTTITFANEALCRALGITPNEIIGKRWRDLANPEDLEEGAFQGLARLTPDRPRFFAENRDMRADGQVGWTHWLNQGIFDDQGNLVEIQSVGRDITALKLAEQAARESENRYRLVAENISDLVCLNDLEGYYLYVSPSCKTELGYEPDELIGHTFYEFIHPDERDQFRQGIHQRIIQGEAVPAFTHRVRTKAGDYRWVETLANPILDTTGKVTQFQSTSRDVTDRVRIERQLRHAALHDSLTGLPNRSLLMERLGAVIQRSQESLNQKSALLFLDLDQFKVINDSLGHLTGDQLLVWVADKLSQVVRMRAINDWRLRSAAAVAASPSGDDIP
jgi:PAS domain S-box-containing protein